MNEQTLAALKAHCHVDHDDDDVQLSMLYLAAVAYLYGAGIVNNGSELFKLAAFSLVLEWYDAGQVGAVTVGLRQIINQLKHDAVAQTGDGL